MISVKLSDELADGVEQFIADRDEPPRGKMSYDDAIHVIVRDWLMSQGYLALPDQAAPATEALDAALVARVKGM